LQRSWSSIALAGVFWLLTNLVNAGNGSLPLIAIGARGVDLHAHAVAMMFSILVFSNKDQAMGLPEGSIRAVIALSLIVYRDSFRLPLSGVSTSGPLNTIANLRIPSGRSSCGHTAREIFNPLSSRTRMGSRLSSKTRMDSHQERGRHTKIFL